MKSRLFLGAILTVLGVVGQAFAIFGLMNNYLTTGALAGIILLGSLIFFAGITTVLDKLNNA